MPLIPALGRQRQVKPLRLRPAWSTRASAATGRTVTLENPVLEKKNQTKEPRIVFFINFIFNWNLMMSIPTFCHYIFIFLVLQEQLIMFKFLFFCHIKIGISASVGGPTPSGTESFPSWFSNGPWELSPFLWWGSLFLSSSVARWRFYGDIRDNQC